jgi:hypothetical protein
MSGSHCGSTLLGDTRRIRDFLGVFIFGFSKTPQTVQIQIPAFKEN